MFRGIFTPHEKPLHDLTQSAADYEDRIIKIEQELERLNEVVTKILLGQGKTK